MWARNTLQQFQSRMEFSAKIVNDLLTTFLKAPKS